MLAAGGADELLGLASAAVPSAIPAADGWAAATPDTGEDASARSSAPFVAPSAEVAVVVCGAASGPITETPDAGAAGPPSSDCAGEPPVLTVTAAVVVGVAGGLSRLGPSATAAGATDTVASVTSGGAGGATTAVCGDATSATLVVAIIAPSPAGGSTGADTGSAGAAAGVTDAAGVVAGAAIEGVAVAGAG
ncbi:MAG: hypothetical protein ACLP01_09305 [Solirubrobacteraceae bacterium]